MREIHTIEPVFFSDSKVLILGSFPSVQSRKANFFYGHPRNRFWKVISYLCKEDEPDTVDKKILLLKKHRIALFDVVESCDIKSSSDSSIRNVKANDLSFIFKKADIVQICANGETAYRLYGQYLYAQTQIEAVKLPSTSPANARWSLEMLRHEWEKKIRL